MRLAPNHNDLIAAKLLLRNPEPVCCACPLIPPRVAFLLLVPTHVRTVWISDLHLGTRSSKGEGLLDVLRHHTTDRYYLVDGVVCGHIHEPELRPVQGITYANTGNWVENCTALVEHPDGRLALRRWSPAPEADTASAARSARDGAVPSSQPPTVAPA